MIYLKLTNAQDLRRAHDAFLAANERMLDEVSDLGGRIAVRHVQMYPKFKRRTGHLQRSQKYEVRRLRSGRLLTLYNTADYAEPIEFGSRPHPIPARHKKALRFESPKFWSIQTRSPVWFVKSVRHPGNRPYKFGYRAWRSAYRVQENYLRQRMADLARRF